jgi:hypothetical protein
LLLACVDKDKMAADKVGPALDRLQPLIERDTKQVRDGLPKGAVTIAKLLDEDPGGDPEGVRRSIVKARAGEHNLAVAKSTFFVFIDPEGVVLRSESDPDKAAGESLFKAIEGTKKLADPKAGMVEAYGSMEGLRRPGVEKGADMQWVVGHPVVSKENKMMGSLVTGWSLRHYAYYLEEDARREFTKTAEDKTKPIPLVYVYLVKDNKPFGAPATPDVNTEALATLSLSDKAKSGYTGFLNVDGRKFAVAAKPCPPFGDGAALAMMVSEF